MSSLLEAAVFARMASARAPMHWGEAPRDAQGNPPEPPYFVADGPEGSTLEDDTGPDLAEDVTIRFHAFGLGLDAAKAMLDDVERLFVKQDLAAGAVNVAECYRGARTLMKDPDLSTEGKEVWHGVVDLVFITDRAPGT